jgi:hypothetical protein
MEYNHGKQKLCVKVKDLVIFFNFLQGVPPDLFSLVLIQLFDLSIGPNDIVPRLVK